MKKLTKIVATISDKRSDVEFLRQLYDAGMNVARLNTAHMDLDGALALIGRIREVSDNIAVMLDTKGPEVRTGVFEDIKIEYGDVVEIYDFGTAKSSKQIKSFEVNYKDFSKDLSSGARILIDDGDVELAVEKIEKKKVVCKVVDGAEIKMRKSVNVPGCVLNVPPLSGKDVDFIRFAAENDVEFIAHSFVRTAEDAQRVQKILDEYDSKAKIIAKIENREGVDNIESILDNVYGIMVARGDLGIEIPAHKIPGIQKQLMRRAQERRKPVIVATQMLHSMIDNPRPTRAEVSDIATAIYDGTDAVMLSGETAYGKYPVEAVKVMAETAAEVEASINCDISLPDLVLTNQVSSFLVKSAIRASAEMDVSAIIADSMSGRTIRALSAYRPRQTIFAMCYDRRTMRELALSYGVAAEYMDARETTDEFLLEALTRLNTRTSVSNDDLVLVLAGNFGTSSGATFVEICRTGRLLEHQKYYVNEKKAAGKK